MYRFGALIAIACLCAACARGKTASGGAAAASPGNAAASSTSSAPGADLISTESLGGALSDEDEEALLHPFTGDLDAMVKRRFVRVLCSFNRTNYFLDKAEQRGVTYEAGKAFEQFLNDRLKMKTVAVHVAFIPVRHDQLFSALAAGQGDIAASNLTITQDRAKIANFATPWATDVREVLVLAPTAPPVATPDDLSGREVHVRRSSSYFESLVALNGRLKQAGRQPVRIVEADEQLEEDDLLEMVNASLIPATVVDNHIADLWSTVFTQMRVQRDVVLRSGGEIAWAVRKDAPQLLDAVNAFVAANSKGSATYNILVRKYFQNTKWVKNARANADVARFRSTIDFFKRYGDKYDFPWLLLAAQAYQESGIDQTRVSPVGAVGVMQIKPSTAEGPPVFVKGVQGSADRNIEAGAKYLRFIADQLKDEGDVDRINRGLFAFAAYNAGPARIMTLRRKAEQRGLDPNKWFGNVEMIAARDIGQETVRYVANIYKYYVSYTFILQQMQARGQSRPQ